MDKVVRRALVLLLGCAAVAAADDRFAVLEFFGRTGCGNCNAAGQVVTVLQNELSGGAVLLEYDYDLFPIGRQDRFWATGVSADYLPLVMVGSGYRTSSGWVDFDPVYRGMIDDELARPPRAVVTAYWRRAGDALRAYVAVGNTGPTIFRVSREAAIWVIAYENATVGLTDTWVRSTAVWNLPFDLAPGESISAVIDTPPISAVDWDRMAGLVFAEDRPRSSGAYDMLQAAEAQPAGLFASPKKVVLRRDRPTSVVVLTGPHVLTWSATSDVPWIEVTPASGTLPTAVTLELRSELRPSTASEGAVTFTASGDDMSFSSVVTVAVGTQLRRAVRRVLPVP
jgi:hypothetical protein